MQILEGIQVTPIGSINKTRYSSTLTSSGGWPNSFGWNAWIYSVSTDINFSTSPSTIKLSLVLELNSKSQQLTYFDIQDSDLDCSAGNGGQPRLYNISLNGVLFSSYILYDYSISIENTQKILTVTLIDYSIILDKIYIGLTKRQGNSLTHQANAQLIFNASCSDCQLDGSSVINQGIVNRPISYGSYVGINGQVYDNFSNINPNLDIFSQWTQLFSQQFTPFPQTFDLNGGYLIIGTEEATDETCGDLAQVGYNFNELLASLRIRGMSFGGAFPVGQTDSDFVYKQNYNGTLREVLNQWCADLGYTFYCDGQNFIGIDLNQTLDISNIVQIADPTSEFGSQFALNQNTAILSYKSNSTLNNTFTQSVVVANNRARNVSTDSKSPKRYVQILPMHPIDFNIRCQDSVLRTTALGTTFMDIAWSNSFELGSQDLNYTLPLLDNRTFNDIDNSIALTRYDSTLRDIYCQDQAIYGATPEIQASNFRALGFVPLIEVTGSEMSTAIETLIPQNKLDEVSNICLDKRFYRVYIGYHYPSFKDSIVTWEQAAADSMYKYGIVVGGLLNYFPYMPQNSLTDQSPTGGFYGENGTSLLRTQHSYEPDCQQYYQLRDAPFKDIILYSGLSVDNSNVVINSPPPFVPFGVPNNAGVNVPVNIPTGTIFPQGLFFGEITNDWGTEVEEFKRVMSVNLTDPCVEQYQQDSSYTDIKNGIYEKFQDWKLSSFAPQVTADIERFYSDFGSYFQSLESPSSTLFGDNITGSIFDRTIQAYYNFNYKQNLTCSKLNIMVLTDTRNHPNINVNFTKYGTQFVNPIVLRQWVDKERQAIKRRIQTETQSICSISLLQQMCKDIFSGLYQENVFDPTYRCILDEDKYNFLEEGYPIGQLLQPNSRGLGVNIIKNPIRNNNSDLLQSTFANADYNGDIYYSDILNNQLVTTTSQVNMNIIYPVSFGATANYRGILTSEVDVENRIPEIIDILGTPNNITNNRSATTRVITQQVPTELQPLLDPVAQRFVPAFTVITGSNTSVITTPGQYYNLINQLDSYNLTGVQQTVSLTLAGSPNFFGDFQQALTPASGLQKMNIQIGDNGVVTELEFSSRPRKIPVQESILNRIVSRILPVN